MKVTASFIELPYYEAVLMSRGVSYTVEHGDDLCVIHVNDDRITKTELQAEVENLRKFEKYIGMLELVSVLRSLEVVR